MKFRLRDVTVSAIILVILGALFLPAVRTSQEAARRTTCSNNLKQLGLGIHNYHDTWKCIPAASTGIDAAPRIGWRVRTLPFIEATPIFASLNMKLPNVPMEEVTVEWGRKSGNPTPTKYNQAANIQVPYAMCPDDPRASVLNGFAQTSYSGNLGSQNTGLGAANCRPFTVEGVHYQTDRGKVFFGDTDDPDKVSGFFSRQMFGPITFSDVRDGTSHTFAAGEILGDCHPNQTGWWDVNGAGNAHASTSVPLNTMTTCVTSQREALKRGYFMPECFGQTNTNFSWGFRSNHPRGASFLLGDGSIIFIRDDINYHLYQDYGGRSDKKSEGR